jgi:hypothetical protein
MHWILLNNKKVQILEFDTFFTLSVEFISETKR